MIHPWKRSLPVANVANLVEDHVAESWPELLDHPVPGLWFTGSRIWSLLYPDLAGVAGYRAPRGERDWDIFSLVDGPARELVDLVGLARWPACLTLDKRAVDAGLSARTVSPAHVPRLVSRDPRDGSAPSYDDGYSYLTDRGEVDLWVSSLGGVVAELRDYPPDSHAHCRAAFSLEDGLVVLPNETASRRRICRGHAEPARPARSRDPAAAGASSQDLPNPLGPVVSMEEEWPWIA